MVAQKPSDDETVKKQSSPSWHSERYYRKHPEARPPVTTSAPRPLASKSTIVERLLDLFEQPSVSLALSVLAGLLAYIFFAPLLVLCGVLLVFGFYKTKLSSGHSIFLVQLPTYIAVCLIVAIGLYWAYGAIKSKENVEVENRKSAFDTEDFTIDWTLHVPRNVVKDIKKTQDVATAINALLCNGPHGFGLRFVLIPTRVVFTGPRLALAVFGHGTNHHCSQVTTLEGMDIDGVQHSVEVTTTSVTRISSDQITFTTTIFQYMPFTHGWKFPHYKLSDFGKAIATPKELYDESISYGWLIYPIYSPDETAPKFADPMKQTAPTLLDITVRPNPAPQDDLNAHWSLKPKDMEIKLTLSSKIEEGDEGMLYKLMRQND